MENEEKRNDEKKFAERCCDTSCCEGLGKSKMAECCESAGGDDYHSKMGDCMKGCRWFPLVPVVFGVILLLLGYYLDAEITRVLWMAVAGLTVLLGTFGLIMMSRIKGACCG
jgi:hypothetical protein